MANFETRQDQAMENNSRRSFIKTTGKAAIATALANTIVPAIIDNTAAAFTPPEGNGIGFTQRPLPYAYTALEPAIDVRTMEIHYSKHAAAYAKNLGDAIIAEKVDTQKHSLVDLLGSISSYSEKMRNNAGGHFNHELFWSLMRTPSDSNKPSGKLAAQIEKEFGGFGKFKTAFEDVSKSRFGSGWAWLIKTKEGKLAIGSTPNQDNPLMSVSSLQGTPILALDVWEHAYYLKYQNKRADYIAAWWSVVNWKEAERLYTTG